MRGLTREFSYAEGETATGKERTPPFLTGFFRKYFLDVVVELELSWVRT